MAALKAPFPYFGGKRRAAPIIWNLLGDVRHYVEPFCGSMAVLLARPHTGRRTETVNDKDGLLVNAWRAIQLDPVTTAYHATGPVAEIDYHAQAAYLAAARGEFVPRLEGDPEFHDPKLAGWWLRVMSAAISNPLRPGPWHSVDGKLIKTPSSTRGVERHLPHLGDQGKGINRELIHLGNNGEGVNRALADGGDKYSAILDYLTTLSRRLEHVRIVSGDWRRILTNSTVHADKPTHTVGVFLDPPYEVGANLYTETATGEHTISADVRQWCATTAKPWTDKGMRIILCGYENEHDALLDHGWHKTRGAHTTGGYAKDKTRKGKTENLWLSPAVQEPQQGLF